MCAARRIQFSHGSEYDERCTAEAGPSCAPPRPYLRKGAKVEYMTDQTVCNLHAQLDSCLPYMVPYVMHVRRLIRVGPGFQIESPIRRLLRHGRRLSCATSTVSNHAF